MSIEALLYDVDGTEKKITLKSFQDLQEAVGGGLAELVTTDSNGIQWWANEEGMLLNLPKNPTLVFNNGFFQQPLLGPVVMVHEEELESLPYK